MPRVTKSVTAKAKHKKVLSASKGHYGARSRLFIKLQNNQISNLFNMHLEIEKIEKDFQIVMDSRINAAARDLDMSYSKLIAVLYQIRIVS